MWRKPCLYRLIRNALLFFKEPWTHILLTSKTTKQACEKDLGIAIDDADWQEVWSQAMNISVCNPTKSIQVRIVHRTYITPVVKNKMDANISPLCWKCNSEAGNYVHCLWTCVKLQRYWSGVWSVSQYGWTLCALYLVSRMVRSLTVNTGDFSMYWLLLLERILDFTFDFWIKNAAPTKKSWHNIVMACIPSEYIPCILHSKTDAFYKVWVP